MAKKTPFFWRCKEKPNGTILFNSAWEQGFLKSFLSSRRLFSSFYSGSRFCDCGFGFCRMGGFFTFWLVDVREKRAVVRLRGGRIRFWSWGFSCNRFAAILRSVIGGGCVDLCLYRLLGLKEALQKTPLPSRMEQKCSVRLFLTTPECAVFLPIQ